MTLKKEFERNYCCIGMILCGQYSCLFYWYISFFSQSVFNPCESVAHSGIVVVACVVLPPIGSHFVNSLAVSIIIKYRLPPVAVAVKLPGRHLDGVRHDAAIHQHHVTWHGRGC